MAPTSARVSLAGSLSRHRRSSCLRSASPLASQQRRWAQVHNMRIHPFAASHYRAFSDAAILIKYRNKLDRKAREEGHPDIDSMKKAYADKISSVRREAMVLGPGVDSIGSNGRGDSRASLPVSGTPPSSAPRIPGTASPPPRPKLNPPVQALSSILDLSKASALPIRELTAIWRLGHAAQENSLTAVIPSPTFTAMESTARQFPQFILPVPHGNAGAEMHFVQWTWDAPSHTTSALFTQLADYKARGEWAAPHTTVTHYPDLKESKGVVLMRGAVAADRGVLVDHARWLVVCLQRFYGGGEVQDGSDAAKERVAMRRKLLEWFAAGDARFTVEKLLEEAERLG